MPAPAFAHIFRNPWFWAATVAVLNLLQAAATELSHDEAFYWLCGQYPAWGYFDHPPLAALSTRVGYALLPNELGVRLLPVLMGAAAVGLIGRLLPSLHPGVWALLLGSQLLLQWGAWLAAPDLPLLLGVAVFLTVLKRYLELERLSEMDDHNAALYPANLGAKWTTAVLLGLSMAFVVLAKYHGMVFMGLALLPQYRLLRRPSFWLALALALLCTLPHWLWQYQHQFITFKFHLLARNHQEAWNWRMPLEFVGGQLALGGLFAAPLLLWLAAGYRSTSAWQRSLKWSAFGLLLFFLLNSFRGRAEANWTASAYLPLLWLCHQALVHTRPQLRRWFVRLALPVVFVGILGRALFVWPILPWPDKVKEYQGWRWQAQQVQTFARGLPLAANSYQRASKLSFYTGQRVPALNINSRPNQFTLWAWDKSMQGQQVFFVSDGPYFDPDTMISHPYSGDAWLVRHFRIDTSQTGGRWK